jgi:hypothetical protein
MSLRFVLCPLATLLVLGIRIVFAGADVTLLVLELLLLHQR